MGISDYVVRAHPLALATHTSHFAWAWLSRKNARTRGVCGYMRQVLTLNVTMRYGDNALSRCKRTAEHVVI